MQACLSFNCRGRRADLLARSEDSLYSCYTWLDNHMELIMSITFFCPDAATTRIQPCPEEDPEFWMDVSVLPEVQLANSNASFFLTELGSVIESDESNCGRCPVAQIQPVLDRLTTLLTTARLEHTLGLKFGLGFASAKEYKVRRLEGLHAVFAAGLAHNFDVVWC